MVQNHSEETKSSAATPADLKISTDRANAQQGAGFGPPAPCGEQPVPPGTAPAPRQASDPFQKAEKVALRFIISLCFQL